MSGNIRPPESSFPDFLKDLLKDERAAEKGHCTHLLAAEMHDGKWFCPSCHLVAEGKP